MGGVRKMKREPHVKLGEGRGARKTHEKQKRRNNRKKKTKEGTYE